MRSKWRIAVCRLRQRDLLASAVPTLHELESRITGRVRDDLERVHTDLTDAADLLNRIEWSVALEPRSGTRSVGAWADAVEGLAEELGAAI